MSGRSEALASPACPALPPRPALDRATHGPESWPWFLTGVSRPHDIWQGYADTEDAAFDDFASCWKRWLDWAGLEQLDILERGATR